MACLLEELSPVFISKSTPFSQQVHRIDSLCRSISLPPTAHKRTGDSHYKSYHLVELNDCNLLFLLMLSKQQLALSVRQLSSKGYQMITSKSQESLLLKELTKILKAHTTSMKFCVKEGCLVGKVECLLDEGDFKRSSRLDAIKKVITTNLSTFSIFIRDYKVKYCRMKGSPQGIDFCKKLDVLSLLSTVTIYNDNSEDVSTQDQQMMLAVQQSEDICKISQFVQTPLELEKTHRMLFEHAPCLLGKKPKEELENMCSLTKMQSKKKEGRSKNLQDFNLNMVKLKVKMVSPNPVSQGGASSDIFYMQASMVFVNSTDGNAYNYQEVERQVAVKRIKQEYKQKLRHKIVHQKAIISILKSGCCHYLPCYYITETNQPYSDDVLMDLIRGQQFDDFLSHRSPTISLWTKLYLLANIVTGIGYLADHSIVHLDLKPGNILITKLLTPKIIDFGQAYHPIVCKKPYWPGHTFPYVAPEVYSAVSTRTTMKEAYSEKQDVFAVGIILFEAIFGKEPIVLGPQDFRRVYNANEVLERIYLSTEQTLQYGPVPLIQTLTKVIVQCLHPEPSHRPTLFWLAVMLKKMLRSYIEG